MIRVAFWATTFGADMQEMAAYLVRDPRFDVKVYVQDTTTFWQQPVVRTLPFLPHHITRYGRGSADVLIVDNRRPKAFDAPRIFYLWHGYGWLKPNLSAKIQAEEIASLEKWAGVSPAEPDCPVRWNCFSEQDRALRLEEHGYHPNTFVRLGNPMNDTLARPQISKARARRLLRLETDGPVVLIANTWHYGEPFGHWGGDNKVMGQVRDLVEGRGGKLIARLHDRHRYPRGMRWRGIVPFFKDTSPDNLLHMLAADVMISNYSSILNYWYYTGRPSVHVTPPNQSVRLVNGLPAPIKNVSEQWKTPLDDCGGLIANSKVELLRQLTKALDEPDCCARKSRDFISRHTGQADGHAAQRIADYLEEWVCGSSL